MARVGRSRAPQAPSRAARVAATGAVRHGARAPGASRTAASPVRRSKRWARVAPLRVKRGLAAVQADALRVLPARSRQGRCGHAPSGRLLPRCRTTRTTRRPSNGQAYPASRDAKMPRGAIRRRRGRDDPSQAPDGLLVRPFVGAHACALFYRGEACNTPLLLFKLGFSYRQSS